MTARDRNVLAVVLAVAAVAAAWLLVIGPKRSTASKLGDELTSTQSQLTSAQASLASAQQAERSFSTSYELMARLGQAVPADDEVPSLIVQLQNAANASRVDFQSLALTSNAGTKTATPVATTAASPSATQASTAALPPGFAVGSAGFPTEPFTFTFSGSFFHLSDFLGRVERFVAINNQNFTVRGRLLSLNGISLAAGPGGFPNVTATVAATTYLLPATQGVLAGATAAGPSPATATPVSTTNSTTPATPSTCSTS